MRALRILLLGLLLAPTAGQALTLQFSFLIDTATDIPAGPESIAVGVDPNDSQVGIFVGDPESTGDVLVYKFNMGTSTWQLDRRFNAAVSPFGLDVLPNGNLLVSGGDTGRAAELSALDGSLIGGGIDFRVSTSTLPCGGFLQPDCWEAETAVFANNSIYLSDEANTIIGRFDLSGNPLNLPGLMTHTFLFADVDASGTNNNNATLNETLYDDPGGGAFNPANGHLYFVDDSSGGGASRIFEYDQSGNLVDFATMDLRDFLAGSPAEAICTANWPSRAPDCDDSEGLEFAVIGGVPHLLLAFEDQQVVIGFQIVPEPGTALLLGGALSGLAWAGRRRRA